MTSEADTRFLIGLREAACLRLPGVESVTLSLPDGSPCEAVVALPKSYAKRKRQRYPLLVLLDASELLGSAIEMLRLMGDTKEIRECVMVVIDTPSAQLAAPEQLAGVLTAGVFPQCRDRFRLDTSPVYVFAGDGRAAELVQITADAQLRVLLEEGEGLAGLVRAMRRVLATGQKYGSAVVPLRQPWLMRTLCALSPLLGRLTATPPIPDMPLDARHRLHARSLDRDYELFVTLPASAQSDRARRYPTLFMLDANIEFSIVAETAARLAATGIIEETIVVGIGMPRSEGESSFAFRRFEEYSPPTDGYAYGDELGRIFRSLFAVRGQDARTRIGTAPALLRFIVDEALPLLQQRFPIDLNALGLLGHSAGGTFVGYALQQVQSPFRHYISISPGIAISGSWLMRQSETAPLSASAISVHFSLGSEEKRNAFNCIAGIPETRDYAERLRKRDALEVRYDCFEHETHSSVFPHAVERALTRAFARSAAITRAPEQRMAS